MAGIGSKMKIPFIISMLAAALLIAQANAEYYRYTDQHGNQIYADDINQVPQDRRSKAEVFSETNQLPPFGPRAGKTTTGPDRSAHVESERRMLAARKAELEAEFQTLVMENKDLKKEQKVAVTLQQVKAINKKTVDFNARLKAYQDKKAAYDARIKAFNKLRVTQHSID
jgi:hypothetical protein